jgi:hypothetical protein
MASVVIAGDVSGTCTLQAANAAGTTVLSLPTTSGTLVATGGAPSFTTVTTGLGNAAAPSITFTGDTNTGIFSPTADTIAFTEGGVEAMRITSDGNVNIKSTAQTGTTSSLYVKQTTDTGFKGLTVVSTATEEFCGSFSMISGGALNIAQSYLGGTGSYQPITLSTSGTERMRIQANGQVFVGQTSGSGANEIFGVGTSSDATAVAFRTTNTGQTSDIALFRANRNTTDGSFRALAYYNDAAGAYRFWVLDSGNCQNTNGSYGAFSDIKLKENIVDATPKLEDLSKVRVVSYNLKSNPTEKHIGVIAQELEQVFPAMVEEIADKDADNNNLGTTTKSVKYSIFVPMLIKAIQELKAVVDAQAVEIAALKTKVGA